MSVAKLYAVPTTSGLRWKWIYAASDAAETDAVTTASGNVLANDLGTSVSQVAGSSSNIGVAVAGSAGGSFTIASDGAWTFDPDGDFALLSGSETADTSVTYHASDGTAEAMATLTVTVSAATPSGIPTDSLVVFYKFDSINGTVLADGSGNGHDGYLYGGSIVAGVVDNAVAFDGTTSHGAKTSHLKNLSGGFALSLWVNMSIRKNTYDTIFAMDPLTGTQRLRILNYTGPTIGMLFNFGAATINDTGGQNPSGVTHVIAQYNSTSGLLELYFNNVLVASGTTTTGLVTPNVDAYIGKTQPNYSSNKNMSISGWVDQMRFYNRPLTSEERTALYEEGI